MAFSIETRKEEIERLKNEKLDLLVIGGGITGAGVALQASAAKMKTGLIDMQDFGGGTSSRSTRLVHGGIRYLKTFDVQVVSDTVKERAVIQHIAPHMTQPDPMILPIYDEPGTTFTMFSVKVAMDLYDHLAGIEGDSPLIKYANYMMDKEETLKREPQLNSENLQGAGVYLDYQNNDSRLVVENVKKAHELGCLAVSRLKCIAILHNDQKQVNGVRVHDNLTGEEFEIHADVVINTSGPWSDLVRQEDKEVYKKPRLRPTKGVHLVVDQSRLTVPQPTYFGSGTADGRMIFTIPREGKTYFGTTDTDFTGDYAHPTVEQSDVDYLLNIINKKYPAAHLTINDIEASWAGVRPLIEVEVEGNEAADAATGASVSDSTSAPSAVSRGSSLTEAEDGLITLAGGKLTDYRIMANGAMKKIQQ
ncbi:MAG: glycerol-3-phosphate dehydrogenase/oxidase, partial [Bombilactobacillus sp.]|nr:glycerol-3-phosphate dehydrogenase/oxidase [Bombilactobacillus sp.]